MGEEQKKAHSEDYFGDYRDFWWNKDFLELMAKRWDLSSRSRMLDVGCGQCHWSRLLAEFLQSPAEIIAVDEDPKWAAGSKEIWESFERHDADIEFKKGDVNELPFEDDQFDVVTCQTVLIHLENPKKAVAEMMRVVKPGGVVICAEPNNVSGNLVKSSISAGDSIDLILERIRYALMLEHGKVAAGEGDNSFGDLLPGAFAEAGLSDIQVYLSDKATPLIPPYQSRGEQVFLSNLRAWVETEAGDQNRAEQLRFLEEMGPDYAAHFEEVRNRSQTDITSMLEAVERLEYHCAGGTIMYLVSGCKS